MYIVTCINLMIVTCLALGSAPNVFWLGETEAGNAPQERRSTNKDR